MNTEVKYDQQEKMYSIMKYLNAEKAYFLEMIHFPLKKFDEIERNLRQIIHESSMNLPLQVLPLPKISSLLYSSLSGLLFILPNLA